MTDAPVMRLDLDGQIFDINQDIIDKYPESVLAKSMMVSDGSETELIEIDRDGENFLKILEYSRGNWRAFNLSQMSRIEIKKLLNDLNFFGMADDLVMRCEHELTIKNQRCIETITSEEDFKNMLVGETRILIVLSTESLITTAIWGPGSYIEKALKLVDRDKCRIVGYSGGFEGFTYRAPCEWDASPPLPNWTLILCDPVTRKILDANESLSEEDLLQMIYYANTLHPYALLDMKFTCDPRDEEKLKEDVGVIFLHVKHLNESYSLSDSQTTQEPEQTGLETNSYFNWATYPSWL